MRRALVVAASIVLALGAGFMVLRGPGGSGQGERGSGQGERVDVPFILPHCGGTRVSFAEAFSTTPYTGDLPAAGSASMAELEAVWDCGARPGCWSSVPAYTWRST